LSGHGVIRLRADASRLHLKDERRQGRAQASLKNVDTKVEVRKTGTSGPVDADESGRQSAQRAPSMSFGRESTDCEVIEIMQNPPSVRTMK
jgi:hypothetical protein